MIKKSVLGFFDDVVGGTDLARLCFGLSFDFSAGLDDLAGGSIDLERFSGGADRRTGMADGGGAEDAVFRRPTSLRIEVEGGGGSTGADFGARRSREVCSTAVRTLGCDCTGRGSCDSGNGGGSV